MKTFNFFTKILGLSLLAIGHASTWAAFDAGETVYLEHCAQCHEGNVPKAPHSVLFRGAMQPEAIFAALNDGVMQKQAEGLTEQQKRQVSTFLTGADFGSLKDTSKVACENSPNKERATSDTISVWGMGFENYRFINANVAGLDKDQVPDLELKWAFDYPGASRARSQPTVHNDVIYVGSQDGTVYAIDIHTGCLHWRFKAPAEVRAAVVIDTDKNSDLLYVGDMDGNVYGISRINGKEKWRSHLNDHPDATITGSPQLYEGMLYVPISSKEWATAADPSYACCTFRGAIAAFNTKDGKMIWKNFSIQEIPKPTGKKNSIGADIIAPSGAPIWNSPTIDPERGLLYVGTGESYSSPAAPTSDAVLAFSLKTGELMWHRQLLAGDAWNMSCFIGSSYNCPEENGPDMDIGAPPILVSIAPGKDILLVGQKNGMVFGLDPAREGEIIWKRKIGVGGYAGGVHWGMSVEGSKLFAPNADTDFIGRFDGERFPGVYALDVKTGEVIWYTRAIEDCKEEEKPACDAGVSAAITAIPGVVFAGAFDGQLRAYDSDSGNVIWSTKTNRSFDTLSGRIAKGGAIEADGPVIYKGNLLINSGYHYGSRLPGNVLLNFAIPSK